MERKRPVGLKTIAIIWIIFSIILFGMSCFFDSSYLIFSIILIITAIGILELKKWARILFICVMVLWLLLGLMQIWILKGMQPRVSESTKWLIFALLYLLPSLYSLYYITRPKVKEQFK